MAMLNIRIDDAVHNQLKAAAAENGITLSEYIRDLLMESVVPLEKPELAIKPGSEPAPESMRLFERQVLATLHRILARVLPEGSNDRDGDQAHQLMRAQILESGLTGEYWLESSGYRTELSPRDCRRVTDILEMYRMITFSISDLEGKGEAVPEVLKHRLAFMGFDFNDSLEAHMSEYVEFLIDEGRWSELQPQIAETDGGNSHMPVLAVYVRMLSEFRRIMDDRKLGSDPYRLLSLKELEQINTARIHPANRP